LLTKLSASRERDIAFFESISATANMLSAPLGDEQIETTFTREGKRVTEVVEIGKRIELFKKSVEKDEAKLKGYWKQWDDLQGDFVELGMEVFGPEVFGADANEARDKGFKKGMELLDVENAAMVEELGAEVEEIVDEYLEKMKESEKVSAVLQEIWGILLTCGGRNWMLVLGDNRRSFFKHLFRSKSHFARGEWQLFWKFWKEIVLLIHTNRTKHLFRTTTTISIEQFS
jgi:hypothetical protein